MIESLPKMINRLPTWSRSNIKEDADIRIQKRGKGIEEPPMAIEFLGILLLQTEKDLDRNHALFSSLETEVRVDRYLGCVLAQVVSSG
jgi:hypothetical protein